MSSRNNEVPLGKFVLRDPEDKQSSNEPNLVFIPIVSNHLKRNYLLQLFQPPSPSMNTVWKERRLS
jgi:hypothetical protein